MMKKQKIIKKYCKKCGKLLYKYNKSGFCNKHRDRTGKNNPFYGKKHSKETILKSKPKQSIASKKLWTDPVYRDKVIKGISKPRREGFKIEQSERVTQWYIDNPEQRIIRSERMKESWRTGVIVPNNCNFNRSRKENKLFLKIKELFMDTNDKHTIRVNGRWLLPDIYIPEINLIVEFKGNYWHANPKYYDADDIVHHNISAKEIWELDEKREQLIQELGYDLLIVWEDEYEDENELKRILTDLDSLNWESCSL